MGIRHPREDFGADDQHPSGVSRADVVVGHDHPLEPTGATKGDVIGHGIRIVDLQAVFDPRGNRWHHIGTTITAQLIAFKLTDYALLMIAVGIILMLVIYTAVIIAS